MMQCEVPSSSTGEVVIVAPSVGENVYLKFLIKRLFNFYISVMFLLWNDSYKRKTYKLLYRFPIFRLCT